MRYRPLSLNRWSQVHGGLSERQKTCFRLLWGSERSPRGSPWVSSCLALSLLEGLLKITAGRVASLTSARSWLKGSQGVLKAFGGAQGHTLNGQPGH
jgi:hypothetical protein